MPPKRKVNPWISHLQKYQKSHPSLTWAECMIKARSSYRPVSSKAKGGARKVTKRPIKRRSGKLDLKFPKPRIGGKLQKLSKGPKKYSYSQLAQVYGYEPSNTRYLADAIKSRARKVLAERSPENLLGEQIRSIRL